MMRPSPARAATRTFAQHEDARDLRAAIVEAVASLDAASGDLRALRNAVWTYVRGERAIGVAPGVVILELTEMVQQAKIAPDAARLERTRAVILWCVEAYFGQLGGDALHVEQRVAPEKDDLPSGAGR